MTLRPRSLQGRLLTLVLAWLLAVWATIAAITWVDTRHELDELLDGHLAQAAALLVAQQVRELEDDDHHGIDAPSLHRYAPRVTFQVWHEGRLALRSANAPATPLLPLAGAPHGDLRSVRIDGVDWRVFSARGAERDVQVYVAERLGARSAILRAVLRGTLWPLAAGALLLALAAAWAVRQGLAPLRRLGRALAERDARALQPVLLPDAPAEMRPMLEALNRLFERIETLLASERRFTADAAHELRTPIAAIRTQAQVALAAADEAQRRHALEATLRGCDRAARLVEQLLTLSRLEADRAPALALVDVAALAREVLAPLAEGAVARRQALSLEAEPVAPVAAEATLLEALLRNLVDNALRYSPSGATVRVSVGPPAQGTGVRLVVEDSGPGLDEAACARLGERFFRVPGNEAEGSGLGWSIVRRIAQAHRATVHARRSPQLGGLAVEVHWPADAGGGPGAAR
ncbi:MAG: sensor histidine kinase N-terminal domain-containing protein [Burkholderiales bacterium]|nr:sensor histidine kinase N-terminal domain-containing protein [Burkholderiales bacterium]